MLAIRKIRVRITPPGFRSENVVVAATLLDAAQISKHDLAELYRVRSSAELDLRSLKQTLQMDVLRCKTPELVRQEIWTHLLAYNLIRTVIAQAAHRHDLPPRSISFQGTIQTLKAFAPLIANYQSADKRPILYQHLLAAIANHRAANRPGRYEPRCRKRRPQSHPLLTKPRHEAKLQMLKQVKQN